MKHRLNILVDTYIEKVKTFLNEEYSEDEINYILSSYDLFQIALKASIKFERIDIKSELEEINKKY